MAVGLIELAAVELSLRLVDVRVVTNILHCRFRQLYFLFTSTRMSEVQLRLRKKQKKTIKGKINLSKPKAHTD